MGSDFLHVEWIEFGDVSRSSRYESSRRRSDGRWTRTGGEMGAGKVAVRVDIRGSEVGDSRDCIAVMASASARLTESTSREWMSGILTTIMGRLCQSGREDVKTIPADEVVTRLLLAVERRKTEERGFIVCLNAPSEY